ncbi:MULTISPECIES: acyl-CoA thioesterase [Streptosporangium]|uniref:Acyl-CoA thioester hydrolase n=1 Tax=Streptosporangium brasiliense TaxID=47480 RepID=A0ABT9RDR1_9ACTN|nr:thioesterase family protein [Streptosporangium brasiliense]MDP9866884.1 acyl-CoA thioester hydrolase [Streptosporangium brasiliense]
MTTALQIGHIQPVQIHFEDLDAMGVVHNARYVLLLERALSGYWAEHGWAFDPTRPHFAEIFFVVREFSITYHVPISTVGTAAVHFWVEHLGTTSVVYGFRVLSADHGVVHAEGRRVQVRLDPATLRPSPMSPALRESIQPLVLTAGHLGS